MKVSETKWVNSVLNIIGVNSLRLGGLHTNSNIIIPNKYNVISPIKENNFNITEIYMGASEPKWVNSNDI